MDESGIRINKYLSEIGYCSRREADKLVDAQRVKINGKIPEMGTKVLPGDVVTVNDKVVEKPNEEFVYLALHKPVGIECTTNKTTRNNIVDYMKYPKRIFPVGRLDKASEGLIIMTNDGDIVNKILRAKNNHEKEYIVTVDKPITPKFLQKMSAGVPILDTVTKKCTVEKLSDRVFSIILTQGLNRQIRRMCEYLGYDVKKLKRIRIMNIKLDIPYGKFRELTAEEMKILNQDIGHSSKTEEASY
ncbi:MULTISPECIES: 23S rRNA pseudouridine(2604) synthase RluF [Amniculibacterium]|uniref:23S rRNA pseudouridine(2604) synthase RluF n=1 Tax=Amniculibacterium TaxID=2715289 RepID=UPI000F5B7809|nr:MULTISPECIES: 23S rRNA pseudouridine(2604) synthase RluF [Amniculibacterium]